MEYSAILLPPYEAQELLKGIFNLEKLTINNTNNAKTISLKACATGPQRLNSAEAMKTPVLNELV